MMVKTHLLLVSAAAALLLKAPVADAYGSGSTSTTSVSSTASVSSTCQTPTTATLAFGAYNPLSATAKTATTTISVICTYSTALTVSLDKGTTSGGAISQRLMILSGKSNTLKYNLYTNSNYTTVWGDGTGSSSTVAGTGAGMNTSVSFTVYGQIPSGQNVPVGSYSDTITVTVSY